MNGVCCFHDCRGRHDHLYEIDGSLLLGKLCHPVAQYRLADENVIRRFGETGGEEHIVELGRRAFQSLSERAASGERIDELANCGKLFWICEVNTVLLGEFDVRISEVGAVQILERFESVLTGLE